jgi:hypothetical protein
MNIIVQYQHKKSQFPVCGHKNKSSVWNKLSACPLQGREQCSRPAVASLHYMGKSKCVAF